MEDRTIRAVLYELYCDGELAGKINSERRVPELCCDKALAAIHARLKEKITDSLITIRFTSSTGAKYYSKAIDPVLKILKQELTNGK